MVTGMLAAWVAAAGIGVGPLPGHDFDSRVIFATPKHNLPLLNLPPYPARRVSSPSRPEIGRLWHERTPGEKIAESVFPGPGPQELGAAPDLADALIFAQTRYPLPPVALSPWQDITDATFDDIRRLRPWIKNERRDQILGDLREAQQIWLRQNGYVRTVRTHINRFPVETGADAAPAEGAPGPAGIIRIRPESETPADLRTERAVPKVLPPITDLGAYLAARDSQATPASPIASAE